MTQEISIQIATPHHIPYVNVILTTIADAAKVRGTGIARRSPEYIKTKIEEGKAVIALQGQKFAGFCYIETWGHEKFVANSGLIVVKDFRGMGLAKKIKQKAFELSRQRYPNAKIFGLTTGLAVMKINSDLGYKPVTFSELTDDDAFWEGCRSCVNFDILTRTNRNHCLCTGMLYDPVKEEKTKPIPPKKLDVYGRWLKFKKYVFLGGNNKTEKKEPERKDKKSLLKIFLGLLT